VLVCHLTGGADVWLSVLATDCGADAAAAAVASGRPARYFYERQHRWHRAGRCATALFSRDLGGGEGVVAGGTARVCHLEEMEAPVPRLLGPRVVLEGFDRHYLLDSRTLQTLATQSDATPLSEQLALRMEPSFGRVTHNLQVCMLRQREILRLLTCAQLLLRGRVAATMPAESFMLFWDPHLKMPFLVMKESRRDAVSVRMLSRPPQRWTTLPLAIR
jgi:hypothetical protein